MLRAVLAASLLTVGMSVCAHAGESVYTDLDVMACETVRTYEESGGSDLRCEGLKGLDVSVSDDDARMSVGFGAPARFRTFGPFNGVGRTVEWRVDEAGDPYAAIVRFTIQNDGAVGAKGEVLLVSTIGSDAAPGCAAALVNAANEQTNGMARGAADMSPLFDCRDDDPIVVGRDDGGWSATFNGLGASQ